MVTSYKNCDIAASFCTSPFTLSTCHHKWAAKKNCTEILQNFTLHYIYFHYVNNNFIQRKNTSTTNNIYELPTHVVARVLILHEDVFVKLLFTQSFKLNIVS